MTSLNLTDPMGKILTSLLTLLATVAVTSWVEKNIKKRDADASDDPPDGEAGSWTPDERLRALYHRGRALASRPEDAANLEPAERLAAEFYEAVREAAEAVQDAETKTFTVYDPEAIRRPDVPEPISAAHAVASDPDVFAAYWEELSAEPTSPP